MRERDDRQQAGELVAIEAVAEIVDIQYAEVRAGLQNLPSRLSTMLAPMNDVREIRGECLKLCLSDRAHAVFRYSQASKRPANIMAS